MTVPDHARTQRDRCAAHLARLRMLAADEVGAALPPTLTPQLSQVTATILAEAEAAGQAVVATMADDRRAAEAARFLSPRLARMATAAQDAATAAQRGDAAALSRQVRRFETLTKAMWTVQANLRPRRPERSSRPARQGRHGARHSPVHRLLPG